MPDYRESTVVGTSWRRAFRIEIFNPYNKQASIQFCEQDMAASGDQLFSTMVKDRLHVSFDPNNTLHMDIYSKLNELYTLLREQRDLDLLNQEG